MYHCFGCGVGGNVITFVMEYENFSFPEALKMLAERAGVALPEQNYSREQRQRENYKMVLKEMNRTAAIYFNYLLTATSAGKHALEYYHDRGFSDETIQRFGLGYANIYENDLYQYLKKQGYTDAQMKDSGLVRIDERRGGQDMFWNRAMVPIMDINGKVVGFGGRVLGDGTPKYINTKETAVFDKSHTLFAMNIARRSKRRGIILCEGYMDVIAMHQAGFDNAAASLGTALTMGHATIVKRYTDEVYLAYDSDGAGRKATMKAIGIMREVGISTRIIDLKPYKDPDEFIHNLGKEAFEGRIADAVTGIVFEIDGIAQGYNLRDPEEKIRFTKEAAKRLSALDEPVVRHSYIEAVAEKYKIDAADLKAMVTRYGTIGLRIADDTGRQLVLEIIDGEPHFYENKLGVLTNSPDFEWQMTNLNNYVNLFPGSAETKSLGDIVLTPFGSGSGFLGIPGDVTPPSRFVRAAFFQASAPQQDAGEETVLQCFQILNNFDIPLGVEFPSGQIPVNIPSATQWTAVSDMTNRIIYYRTMYNSNIRCFDLNKIDFGKVEYRAVPLDAVKQQPIETIAIE